MSKLTKTDNKFRKRWEVQDKRILLSAKRCCECIFMLVNQKMKERKRFNTIQTSTVWGWNVAVLPAAASLKWHQSVVSGVNQLQCGSRSEGEPQQCDTQSSESGCAICYTRMMKLGWAHKKQVTQLERKPWDCSSFFFFLFLPVRLTGSTKNATKSCILRI